MVLQKNHNSVLCPRSFAVRAQYKIGIKYRKYVDEYGKLCRLIRALNVRVNITTKRKIGVQVCTGLQFNYHLDEIRVQHLQVSALADEPAWQHRVVDTGGRSV